MAEDTEKRFYSIMNKLFHSPKSKAEKPRGQKRLYQSMVSDFKGQGYSKAAQAPPCRPWDRSDLMRRLATFKSMRWFAKPKAVDAVNCARRGWINVDLDIIACEVCGARLQFSTPSTWNQQQVEKAALVFSLKLDNGHKLLCPWIDNACDESLGLFPPTPGPVLVDQYKERSSVLLQLSALPKVSTSAIESLRNPLLKHFLSQSTAVVCGTGPNNSSSTEYLGGDMELVPGGIYYQAHRLLSLCGWEPRLLPYMVDSGDQSKLSGSNDNISDSLHGPSGDQNNKLSVYVTGVSESIDNSEDLKAAHEYYDPNSTVLDCKFCGASIGLWAFATVPRPLEMVRVVGCSDIGGGGGNGNESTPISNHVSIRNDVPSSTPFTFSREPLSNLTIAGGPPPTKQNFRAMISLPVIGRNLRARFSYLSSEVTNTNGKGHTSQTIITENSSDKFQSELMTGPKDIACASNSNGVQSERPLAILDGNSNGEQMDIDNAIATKPMSLVPSDEQRDDGVRETTDSPLRKDVSTSGTENDLRSSSADQKMVFDPIQQHRHFCPWIASTDTTAPGWQQTLSALLKERVFLLPENEASPPSPSLIKVDDPITSIRRLFESPPAKKSRHSLI